MSQSEPNDIIGYTQGQHERSKESQVRETINEVVDDCARRLTEPVTYTDVRSVARQCETILYPLLSSDTFVEEWGVRVGDNPKWHQWAFAELERCARTAHLSFIQSVGGSGPGEGVIGDDVADDLARGAFESLVAIAERQGYVQDEFSPDADAYGHELQVGKIQEPLDRDSPDFIRIVDPSSHPPVSVNQGLPGFGKSTAIGTEIEDRYQAGKKIIDVVDLSEFENGLIDIPQSQDDLRDVRADMGLPVDVLEADDYVRPSLEILVPLTRGVSESEIPVREDGETVIRPFTIPAAEIPRKALNLMLSHLTDVQQMYLDRAYQEIRTHEDWSLHDLADAVLATDAQEGVKRRVYNTLATLQEVGFIRTRECEYALDWERVFRETDTVTAFSQGFIEDGAHKFMVLSYLIHSLYHERQNHKALPSLCAVFRELHHIAPNDRAARQDEREREIQRGMVAAFQELCSMHRHEDIEVLCDTQQLMGQINKRAREHVERVITFRSQMGTLKPLFKDMVGLDGERHSYMTTIAREFSVGQAAVIGYTGTNRALEMPINMAPPMSHHLDADSVFDSGLDARTQLLEQYDELPDEVLESSPWDWSLPDELEFEPLEVSEDRDVVKEFAAECLEERSGQSVTFDEVMEVLDSYANDIPDDVSIPDRKVVGKKISKLYDFDRDRRRTGEDGQREVHWVGMGYTQLGKQYL